jgi:hypothetical protein
MNLFSPSPERRRLRFSFQINNVKDPKPPQWPHRLTPDVGGGGYLSNPEVRVKWFFSNPPNKSSQTRKTSPTERPVPKVKNQPSQAFLSEERTA